MHPCAGEGGDGEAEEHKAVGSVCKAVPCHSCVSVPITLRHGYAAPSGCPGLSPNAVVFLSDSLDLFSA